MSQPPKSTMRAPAARWVALSDVAFGTRPPGGKGKGRRGCLRVAPSVLLPERLRPRDAAALPGAPSVGRASDAPAALQIVSVLRAVLLPERFRGYAFGGSGGRPALSPPRSPQRITVELFLEREDHLHQLLDVGVADLRVGGHRNLAPGARAAFLDLCLEHRGRLGIAAVLRGDVLVGRAEDLLVLRMAGAAAVLLHHVFELVGKSGRRDRQRGDCKDCGCGLHWSSIGVGFDVSPKYYRKSPPRCPRAS